MSEQTPGSGHLVDGPHDPELDPRAAYVLERDYVASLTDRLVATGGGTFIPVQDRWGAYGGALAVAVLKDQELRIISFDESGKLTDDRSPEVMHDYGRLRTVSLAADGDLLITTDNGGEDVLLRVTPR